MLCVVCAKEVPVSKDQNPWCSEECREKWQRRQPFLFSDLKPKPKTTKIDKPMPEFSGENLLAAALMHTGAMDDTSLVKLRGVSKTTRPLAIEKEVGPGYHKAATHYQKRGNVIETTAIGPDRMLEIAIMAYNTAILLHQAKKPVILYRIAGKGTLTEQEKQQTLSSSVRAKVDTSGPERKEVWPIEKTAAWIQGAMRARVSFVLLNDPREDLVGGVDKKSDAIYVREIHQISLDAIHDRESIRHDRAQGAGRPQDPAVRARPAGQTDWPVAIDSAHEREDRLEPHVGRFEVLADVGRLARSDPRLSENALHGRGNEARRPALSGGQLEGHLGATRVRVARRADQNGGSITPPTRSTIARHAAHT